MTKPKDESKGMPEEIWAIPYPFSEWRHTGEQACHVARMDGCGNPTKYVRADLAPASQWRDISTAPFGASDKPETYFIGMKIENGKMITQSCYRNEHGIFEWYGGCRRGVTNWMPIPPTKDLADAGKEGV